MFVRFPIFRCLGRLKNALLNREESSLWERLNPKVGISKIAPLNFVSKTGLTYLISTLDSIIIVTIYNLLRNRSARLRAFCPKNPRKASPFDPKDNKNLIICTFSAKTVKTDSLYLVNQD